MSRMRSSSKKRRGGALLAVLWLSAALAAIAFSVASTVRGETERASTLTEGLRTHYLAAGAVERAILWCQFAPRAASPGRDGKPVFNLEVPRMVFGFPTGEALVEVIPETSKLDINRATGQQLTALAAALGADPAQAQQIAVSILHWRSPGGGPLDGEYLSLGPTFRPRHASVQDVEELIYVKGMTPELFHGTHSRDNAGRMVRHSAFKDCVSVWGAVDRFDVNTVEPGLLSAFGMPPEAIQRVLEIRRVQPIVADRQMAELSAILGPAVRFLRRGGGNTIYTLRATARLRLQDGRLSDLRKSVAATVKFLPPDNKPQYHILRWDDQAVSEVSQW